MRLADKVNVVKQVQRANREIRETQERGDDRENKERQDHVGRQVRLPKFKDTKLPKLYLGPPNLKPP